MKLRRYTRTPMLWLAVVVMLVGPSILIANAASKSKSNGTTQTEAANLPSVSRDKASYEPGETINLSGSHWAAGESVTITISSDPDAQPITVQAIADSSGSFSATTTMPEVAVADADAPSPTFGVNATGLQSGATAHVEFGVGRATSDGERIIDSENYWNHRLTYPTGKFNPKWVRDAARQDSRIKRGVPRGKRRKQGLKTGSDEGGALIPPDDPLAQTSGDTGTTTSGQSTNDSGLTTLALNSFVPLGPAPERMTGCSGCYDYGTTSGRVNDIVIDPTTTTNGSIVAYSATVGGGVWKTTNCCSATTTWTVTTDSPLINTTAIDSLTIDPNNHNTIYAGTGDLNYGSFSMGSQGILKSTDAGANWTVLGADVFGPSYAEPAGQFPQYDAVGKVRVDPNNSNNIVAGTKKGLFFSYDGGATWTNCLTNSYTSQRQDITGLELTNIGGTTRIIAAVGVRGFATAVQYDLGANGANGLYKGTMPASGCPTDFAAISSDTNGFIYGAAVTGSPYGTAAQMHAASGSPYVSTSSSATVGNQLGRIDIAVAPSDPNVIYAQVGSIAANNNSGCGNAAGCQLGAWVSADGGATWSYMAGSQGGALRACASSGTGSGSAGSGDYPQNWYDQGVAVDPNNADRVIFNTFDTWIASRTGTQWYDLTCGYNGTPVANHVVHVDHHAQAFVPGSSSIFLNGGDGGTHGSSNFGNAVLNTSRPTWFNMDTGYNTIEFYSGDISGNFATSATPAAAGGAQDNGPSVVLFSGSPTGPAQWQMGTGGDGFYARIDPVGTGTSLRYFLGNNSGGLSRCTSNCTAGGGTWSSRRGNWTGDQQSFILPFDLFHGGIAGGDDCQAAGASTGCGHLIAGTTRVWETVLGASTAANSWYVTNNPTNQNLTRASLGNRSFINQVKYHPKWQSVAIVGTNDGWVQMGFNLGTGVASQATWVNVSDSNTVLPNRPVLGIALDPSSAKTTPIGYAAVGGFNENTPSTPGHVFRVTCTAAQCASVAWRDVSGNLPNIPVDSVIVNPNFPQQVFAGTDFGLYYTDDVTANSVSWSRFSNLPAVMIWDMQIDRGSTTLSLWTRGRGAYAWALPTGPENPLPTALAVASASGPYNGSATLSAVLTSGGNPVAGKSVAFTLNGNGVGSGTTDASGTASVSGSLAGLNPGSYPGVIGASFAGDSTYAPASGSGDLTVTKADQTINFGALADRQYGSGDFTVSATATSGLTVSFAASGYCTVSGTTVHMTGVGVCTITASQAGDTNYSPAPNVSQSFNVTQPPVQSGTVQIIATGSLVKNGNGTYTATVSIKSNGTGTAQNVNLTVATLGSGTGSPLPQAIGNIPPGAVQVTTVTFPATSGASGTAVVERFGGNYTGGTFTTSVKATLP